MAMTIRELEFQKKAKADEARRIARLQAQANQGPLRPVRVEPIARPAVASPNPDILRGAKPRAYPPGRPEDLPVTPNKMVDSPTPAAPNLAPNYNPAGNQTVEQWYQSLPPSEQFRQRTQPGIAQNVAPPTQADLLRRKVMEPAKSFSEYGDKLAALTSLPFASRTATEPPQDNRLVGTRDRGGNLQVFTPDEASRVMQEDEFEAALAAETGQSPLRTPPADTSRPRSAADQPFEEMPDGSLNLNSRLGALDTSRYNADGTANNGIIGSPLGRGESALRGYQPSQSTTAYGPRQPNGRRTMTINRSNPYAGMSDAAIAPIAEQKRQEIAARRLSGAAAGGAGLRNALNQIGRQAQQTFSDVRNRTNNSKAAERAANAVYQQGDQLLREQFNQVGFDRNAVNQYGIDASTALGYNELAANQQYRAAQLGQAAATASDEELSTYLTNITSEQDPETGAYRPNPVKQARVRDLLGAYRGPDRRRVIRDLVTLDNYIQGINEKFAGSGIAFNDVNEIFDLSGGGVKIRGGTMRDLLNARGYGIEEFASELLPFGDSGDVIEGIKNGRNVAISAEDIEQIGLTPRIRQYLYGDR